MGENKFVENREMLEFYYPDNIKILIGLSPNNILADSKQINWENIDF